MCLIVVFFCEFPRNLFDYLRSRQNRPFWHWWWTPRYGLPDHPGESGGINIILSHKIHPLIFLQTDNTFKNSKSRSIFVCPKKTKEWFVIFTLYWQQHKTDNNYSSAPSDDLRIVQFYKLTLLLTLIIVSTIQCHKEYRDHKRLSSTPFSSCLDTHI